MDFTIKLLNSKKVQIFIGIISLILFAIIILNSFYPKEVKFNNYYMILVHMIAIYGVFQIGKFILEENGNVFKFILLDSRILFLLALVLLFYTPFYLILGDKKGAESLSIYAYYFLVLGVVYEIILSKFEKKIEWMKSSVIANKENNEKKKDRLEKLALKKKEKKERKKRK